MVKIRRSPADDAKNGGLWTQIRRDKFRRDRLQWDSKKLHLLKKSRHLGVVAEFIAPLTVLPFTRASADHSSRVRQELAGAGQTVGPLDILIAGHALEHQLALDTGNAREFSRVNGLRLEDWI